MSTLKRIRLPGGKWITRKLSERESDPAALANAKPEEIWTAADGRQLLVRDMDMQHILAVMSLLESRAEKTVNKIAANTEIIKAAEKIYPVYKTLCAEVKRRLENKPAPEPRNRMIRLED